MRDLIWFEPGIPLAPEVISSAEGSLGVVLPQDYKILVTNHSGASNPEVSEFLYNDGRRENVGNFGTLLTLQNGSPESVFEAMTNLGNQLPESVIPVVHTGSGDCVCLDYRNSKLPKIVYFAHERNGEQSIVFLADSFTEFLDMLREPLGD